MQKQEHVIQRMFPDMSTITKQNKLFVALLKIPLLHHKYIQVILMMGKLF
jgi:hypothetical protein